MSYTYHIGVCGMTFCVNCLFETTGDYLKAFMIDGAGEHTISITQDDIDREREIDLEENKDEPGPRMVSDRHLETVAMLRKMAEYIIDYDRILMHGSAIAVNGKGYIFTAISGTGKSTHTALLRKLHGENAVMINDDKPFLYLNEGKVYVCGTPWMGKHRLGNNITVPLEGIYFLRRSESNELSTMSPENAVPLLFSQCHRPADPAKMMTTLGMLDQILGSVSLYDFGCNMDISAAETSSSVMK